MDTKLLYSHLTNLEKLWGSETISREEVKELRVNAIYHKLE